MNSDKIFGAASKISRRFNNTPSKSIECTYFKPNNDITTDGLQISEVDLWTKGPNLAGIGSFAIHVST